MALNINSLRADPELVEKGAWVDYLMGSKLLVARFNNRAAENARSEFYLDNLEKFTKEGLTEKEREANDAMAEKEENRILSQYVLLGWSGIQTADGSELEYSQETAFELLCDPQLEEFRAQVINLSQQRQNFRAKNEQEAVEAVKAKRGS